MKVNPKRKRKKLDPEEREKQKHITEIRTLFVKAGFKRVLHVSDKEFEFQLRKSDFDDIFIFENIIILTEYTSSKSENISKHLLPKKIIYDLVLDNSAEFLLFFANSFESFSNSLTGLYDYSQYKIVILYCSKNDVKNEYKTHMPRVKFFDYGIVKYFSALASALNHSSKYELLKYFGFEQNDVGEDSIKSSINDKKISGTLLPESSSNFPPGFKVVSFYIDADFLINASYVLRKDGWNNTLWSYQRMIIASKIKSIRKYLHSEKRVFINNIVVTLPSETKLLDSNGDTVDPKTLLVTAPVTIQVPNRFCTIGLIDGQHRVFAYHEGGEYENEIKILRKKQNLLVTGIVYPVNYSESDRLKFEANLFLEINSNQSNAKSDIKQAILLILKPASTESIARALIQKLDASMPLENKFERHFYEKGKIKTTSIVSYALQPIVKLSGEDSFFSIWPNQFKDAIHSDNQILQEYIEYCKSEINNFLLVVRQFVGDSIWQIFSKQNPDGILSTTTINGLIICLRKIILNDKSMVGDVAYYREKLKNIKEFDFKKYKSSQYGDMGNTLFEKYFR